LNEDQVFERLLNAEPNADAERRQELRTEAGKRARKNVAFLDATFSVQKSVSLLHTAFEAEEVKARKTGDAEAAAAWGTYRQAVEDGIWAGNNAMLDYLAEHAGYARIGHHGGASGRFADGHDWTVAQFFQHDNRDHDPQLHVHNAVLNRVEGPDGKWRTLDGKALHVHRGAAAAVGERTMEEYVTCALGVRFLSRADGKAREIEGVSQSAIDMVSTRRQAITEHVARLEKAFEQRHDRAPNNLERTRLQQQATLVTRPGKSHTGETREQFLNRLDAKLATEKDATLSAIAQLGVRASDQTPEPHTWSPRAVLEAALAEVQAKKAGWTAADLKVEINRQLPDYLGLPEGAHVAELMDTLAAEAVHWAVPLHADSPGDEALPAELRLANGESVYHRPGARLYATPEHVHSETALVAATAARGAAALPASTARTFVDSLRGVGINLGDDQAAAVHGVLTSGARLESLVGPAGTGKSFVVGMLAKAWSDPYLWEGPGRRVVGLASSQIATEVLAGEGVEARNVARWLGAQRRLADGHAAPEDEAWRLRGGDLVVVDESAMTDRADLSAIHHHAHTAGAKVLLTGDHRQLAAVGAAGGMELVAGAGNAYELTEARRFTHDWEREASLRLRERDQAVLDAYREHGRLIDAGAIEQAESSAARAWLGDTLAGKQSLLLVDSNEQAARLSTEIRTELIRFGRVTEHGVALSSQGTFAGVGDVVQGRYNAWNLAGYQGNRRGPINRERYTVLATTAEGGLTVAPILGGDGGELLGEQLHLPPSYVAEHVELGYASTYHASQGLTVDTSHPVITPNTSPQALYVGLTRGREANTGHVTTRTVGPDAETGEVNEAVHRNPSAVLAGILETDDTEDISSATTLAEESARQAVSLQTLVERLAAEGEQATAGRTAMWLDELVDAGALTAAERRRVAAENGAATLGRLLRRVEISGQDPRAALAEAAAQRSFEDAREITNVLHSRIRSGRDFHPAGDGYTEWTPRVDDPAWAHRLALLGKAADTRRADLAHQVATEQPHWAVEAFGAVPDDPAARADWERRAGAVAAHRELAGHDDPADPLGPAPKPGQVEAHATWRAAWDALGRPEVEAEEAQMSDGQLRARQRAYQREQNWAPAYVGNHLAQAIQDADHYRQTAQIRTAEADATTNPDTAAARRYDADAANAVAEALDSQIEQLREVQRDRAQWLVDTASTRVRAERAGLELANRHADDHPAADGSTTAEEWIAAHRTDQAAEDPHREITDKAEFTEIAHQRDHDVDHHRTDPSAEPAAALETGVADIRDIAAGETRVDEDTPRVPTAAETTDTLGKADRAINEMAQRHAAEEIHEAEEAREAQLARWHDDDRAAAEQEAAREAEQQAENDWGID
jgi:conjugative relaxase-like TrwC/TraI family protein